MADKISSFSRHPARKMWGIYPWDEWMDGSIWRITQGVDFTSSVASMRGTLVSRAYRSPKQVRTSVQGEVIEFQFFDQVM